MTAVITSGPARSDRQKTRKTKTARHAYFVPWDNGGEGGWRYLPVDTVHHQQIQGVDELGNPLRPVDLYIYKGFIPVEMIPEGDPRLDLLPLNWREHAMTGADPEWRVEQKAAPVAPAPETDAIAEARQHWVDKAEAAAAEDSKEF